MRFVQRLWKNERIRTLLLVNLACIMETADEALLPGVYKEIGETLHTSLAALGSLTLLRSITQSLCFPLAAYFSLHYDRSKVIASGAFMWSIATFFVGISSTYPQMAVSRALNGIGLAIVIPATQSIVADASDKSNRGLAFGLLQVTSNLGRLLGGFFSIALAGTSFLGISGWRISFLLVTVISIILGFLLLFFAVDPLVKTKYTSKRGVSKVWSELKEAFGEAHMVIKIPTFQVLVAQGIVGTFPWAALAFAPMWLELKGFTHSQTAYLLGVFTVSTSVGGVFGGFLGDVLSRQLPNAGRIMLAQIGTACGIPLAAVLLLGLPYQSSSVMLHGVVFVFLGFCTSWNATAVNNPIFAEIVPEKSRTSVYALDNCFESFLASFAAPVVGLLAEKLYGYTPPHSDIHMDYDTESARSLGKALYTAYCIPYTLCCLTYSFLYCTYPRDRDRVARVSHKEVSLSEVAYSKSKDNHFVNESDESESMFGDLDEVKTPDAPLLNGS